MTHLVCINPSTILIPGKTRARDRPSLHIRASYIYKTTLVALIHTFSIILVEIFLYTFFPADNTISYKKKTKKFYNEAIPSAWRENNDGDRPHERIYSENEEGRKRVLFILLLLFMRRENRFYIF